ncbi:MAG: hypothetical protein CL943_02365 [Candidatus Diapherotrites archaeon]|uniref:Glycerophosphoryl diester phosphodiesterase membrane domain-containing protein n=1 Tax=Candidatus Iainarchaeum sp. TaxID=3101447 RepID=A0A2D6M121_9ARCH|nr:hypothetical protein [Candidatus Diapherotrites archaeon]
MIDSILKAFKSIVKKPALLIPPIVIPTLLVALIFLFIEPLANLLVEVLFLENVPESPLFALPIHFLAMYPIEILSVVLLVFVFSVIWAATAFFYSKVANDLSAGGGSIGEALRATKEAFGKIVALIVFFYVIGFFSAILLWLFMLLPATIGFILSMLFAVLLFYVFVKLSFTIPAMAIDNLGVKEALAKSWVFTKKKFLSVIIFLFVVSVLSTFILRIEEAIETLFSDEIITSILFLIFWLFATVFSNLAVAFYYLKKQFGK